LKIEDWAMSDVIPLKAYQILEDALGKEKAQALVEVLSTHISNELMNTKESLKVEISEELKKELATKYDLKISEVELKKEIDLVKKEIDLVRKEIDLVRKDMKIMEIRLIAIIVIINIIFNPNALELLGKLFGIIK
jgi:CRISPR/Cas system-associated exonuclease Cas4 (RecB family)